VVAVIMDLLSTEDLKVIDPMSLPSTFILPFTTLMSAIEISLAAPRFFFGDYEAL